MKIGVITKKQPVHREVWKVLDPGAKLVLLANGSVTIDNDGLPCVASETLATTIRDVETALGLR